MHNCLSLSIFVERMSPYASCGESPQFSEDKDSKNRIMTSVLTHAAANTKKRSRLRTRLQTAMISRRADASDQCRRFVETAHELGADESPDAMDRAIKRVVKPKKLVRPDERSDG
jgi:hypothetical protein